MIIKNFSVEVLEDYEKSLNIFFDQGTGAVFEPGRDDGTPAFLFTEVTGYALSDFILLYSLTGNASYIRMARASASWIINHAEDPCGGVLTRYYLNRDSEQAFAGKSFAGRKIYAFDTAICLTGLSALYGFTKDPLYLDAMKRMGGFLTDKMINAPGEVTAIYDAKTDTAVPGDRSKWSACPGAFHAKVAEALINLHEATQEGKYRLFAEAVCEKALKFQSERGNFETSAGLTELHPHCYATEGLLYAGRALKNERYTKAALRATLWALDNCKGGEIPQSFDFATGSALSRFRTDALSQVLALASDLRQTGLLNAEYFPALDALAAKILAMKTGKGGWFRYGYYERDVKGKTEADTKSYWTNMFCLRGLYKYYLSGLLDDACVAILAGGIGSRVWPISCENRPKPVSYALLGDRSLLQETIRRYTHGDFIRPERIFIVCSPKAVETASKQAAEEGVPRVNCISENEPKGTLPALNLALDGIPDNGNGKERIIIVSMGDNVFSPYEKFQHSLTAAVFAARENDCIVSLGKPLDKETQPDERFGHMAYDRKIDSYRVREVERFVEKPAPENFEAIKSLPGSLAWECGTVVFKERCYRQFAPPNPGFGNLAEDLLAKAAPWSSGKGGARVATALLDPETCFEDFGVPGANVRRFFKGNPKYDRGGNICLGNPEKIRLLSCSGTLVISDALPIEVYGLKDFVVIDNSATNTTVVMPIKDVNHLTGLYRLFSGAKEYEPFITGGPRALLAEPTTFAEKSPNAHASSSFGLVFAYNFDESLTIKRTRDGLRILNNACPELDRRDFNALCEKQSEDPKLAQHLINVGALAGAVAGSGMLSAVGREVLNKLCLYHAFGGYLTDEGERREEELVGEFEKVSKLDRRLLDSGIIYEMVRLYREQAGPSDDALIRLMNASVNSAVEFVRRRVVENQGLRDIVVALIQAQTSPHLYSAFRKDLAAVGLGEVEAEVDRIFACFKLAQNFSNGRWLWKRKKRLASAGGAGGRGFLQYDKGMLEDFPFIIAYSARWLKSSEIDPAPYINRINGLVADNRSSFMSMINHLQEGLALLECDNVYISLLSAGSKNAPDNIRDAVETGIKRLSSQKEERYQLTQLLELPESLDEISAVAGALPPGSAEMTRDVIAELYHKHWRLIKPHVSADTISGLLK